MGKRIVGLVATAAVALAFGCELQKVDDTPSNGADGGLFNPGQGTGTLGTGATKSAAIGPAGGTITLEGATLTVPAGALASEQTITVTSVNGIGPTGAKRFSPVYRFEPAGLKFQSPATVEITYAASIDTISAALFWSSSDGLRWDTIPGTQSGGSAIKGQTAHFSSAFVGDGTVGFPARGPIGTDAGTGTDTGTTSGTNTCGPVFNDKCFRCQWEQCADTFALCFGAEGSKGNISGDCKTYGQCICNAKTLAESQNCSIATDTACTTCSESKGLGACVQEKCLSACSGGG